jgi:hypothetical protein
MPRITFLPGTYEGRKFDVNGATTESKPYTVPRESSASADRRGMPLPDKSVWWHVTDGIFAGYWVRETASVHEIFSPSRRLQLKAGTHAGFRFDPNGTVTNKFERPISADSGAPVGGRMQQGTQPYWLVEDGIWKDFWVPESAVAYEGFSPPARVSFRQGAHTGQTFDGTGAVLQKKDQSLSGDSSALSSGRVDIAGTSYWLIDAGAFAAMWVASSARVYRILDPAETVSFGAGPHTGFTFDAGGNVASQVTKTLSTDSSAPAKGRTTIGGRVCFLMAAGLFAETWVPE